MKIILASGSPRRKELLNRMGINDYSIIVSNTNESLKSGVTPKVGAQFLSLNKAYDVFNSLSGDRLVIGSDTMVYYRRKILNKPKDANDAYNMLKMLSGKVHKVYTGLSVIVSQNDQIQVYSLCDSCKVKFKKLSEQTILKYIESGEPMDKAGAYAIQGLFGMFIEKINGNHDTVMGLPTHKLYEILKVYNLVI